MRGEISLIKINLARKKTSGLLSGNQLSFSGALAQLSFQEVKELPLGKMISVIIFCVAANQALIFWEGKEIARVDEEIIAVNQEIAQLKKEAEKYAKYDSVQKEVEADTKDVSTKLETVRKLMMARRGPVKLFEVLSKSIPKEVWVLSLRSDLALTELQCSSLGFSQVSDFIKSLNSEGVFSSVELMGSRQGQGLSGEEVTMFALKATRKVD